MASNIVNMTPQADPNLTRAFGELGKSFIPTDLSNVYKTQADTSAIVSSNIKRLQLKEEEELNAKGEVLEKIAGERMAMVAAGDYDESFTKTNEVFLENLQKRLENAEEGSTEYRKIMGEANSYFAGVDNFIEASIDAQTTLAGNSENPINFVALERAIPGASDVLKAMSNKTATYEEKDGKLYAVDPVTNKKLDTSQIAEVKDYRRDLKIDKDYKDIITSQQNLGGKGIDYDAESVEADFTDNVIPTKAKYFDASTRKLRGFESSFINAMAENKELHKKIMELYPERKYNDKDGDGIIDELAGQAGKAAIDLIINDYGGGSGNGPKVFKEYVKLQAKEEYNKFRTVFDKNKQEAINKSQDTQWKTNLRNLTSSVKRLANSDKPTQLTSLKNGGRIIFDKKNKIMKLEQNTGFEYTKDEAVALGNPDLAGTNKKEMLTINPNQMMDVVFEKWGHEGFEKTFPKLFKIYGAGEPIIY
tara:strand:- start:2260 stop:3687 length:1428 start_codon:yes stop_codon:yes gene_type:complete